MFIGDDCKHPHFESACSRFTSTHVISKVAAEAGIDAQVLRNKLNPDQPHQLTVADLIALYHATEGDETLFDGMLLECSLTAVAIPKAERATSMIHQVIDLNAQVASVSQRTLELTERGRITRSERNTMMSSINSIFGACALFAIDIERRFQAVPPLACASDLLMQTMTM
ncbi:MULTISPECIES: phage regulatory CII family protein [Aeromonas]|uniref:phage regulatory CII family protein n=1 Tax=Aeromonas TaxID=642 RepID=UPI001C5A678D|nr:MULTISPECIES: phage regulatory CII family protein [Aeromonas]MBW3846216.1 hypothetical protein [Aeromonas hydrophila]